MNALLLGKFLVTILRWSILQPHSSSEQSELLELLSYFSQFSPSQWQLSFAIPLENSVRLSVLSLAPCVLMSARAARVPAVDSVVAAPPPAVACAVDALVAVPNYDRSCARRLRRT